VDDRGKEQAMQPATAGRARAGSADQAEVIAFLSDPASYAAEPECIKRFETHGALVFLAGEEAWKIKRAVRFPYMYFSHGSREMPVRGHRYRAATEPGDSPAAVERRARAQINALVRYLETIQER
jgi:hypothetical protein